MGKVESIKKIESEKEYDPFRYRGRTDKEAFNDEKIEVDKRIIGNVFASLNKLSLVRATLNNDDLFELKEYELSGTMFAINEVFDLLDAAVDLHTRTH